MNEHSQRGNAPDQVAYHDLLSLKARGWTARLVRHLLGEPDDTDRTRVTNTGRPKNLYCAKRVALVELHDPQFRAEREKAAMYSGRLKQTQDAKKKNLVGIVEAMDLPDFDLPFDELLGQANKKLEVDKNLAGTAPERVALEIYRNSLKHRWHRCHRLASRRTRWRFKCIVSN